jgi:Ser-tRNA(Ala) deacylase AlaX
MGKVPAEDHHRLLDRLNASLSELIAAGGAVQAAEQSYEDAKALCGGSLPPYWGEASRPRVVVVAGMGCPCGGTHVADVRALGSVRATAIRVKKGVTRVSYETLDAPA